MRQQLCVPGHRIIRHHQKIGCCGIADAQIPGGSMVKFFLFDVMHLHPGALNGGGIQIPGLRVDDNDLPGRHALLLQHVQQPEKLPSRPVGGNDHINRLFCLHTHSPRLLSQRRQALSAKAVNSRKSSSISKT